MRFKRFKPAFNQLNHTNFSCNNSNSSNNRSSTLLISDLSQKLSTKDKQIENLNDQLSKLAIQLSALQSTMISRDNNDFKNSTDNCETVRSENGHGNTIQQVPDEIIGDETSTIGDVATYQTSIDSHHSELSDNHSDCSFQSYHSLDYFTNAGDTSNVSNATTDAGLLKHSSEYGFTNNNISLGNSLIKTYEESNLHLLEKLKLKESENISLIHKLNQLDEQLFFTQQQLQIANEKLAAPCNCHQLALNSPQPAYKGLRPVDSLLNATTIDKLVSRMSNGAPSSLADSTTFAPSIHFESLTDTPRDKNAQEAEEAKEFISDLFDAIPFINFDGASDSSGNDLNSKDSALSLKSSDTNSSSSTANTTFNSTAITSLADSSNVKEKNIVNASSARNSCDSLLSLNKSAINFGAFNNSNRVSSMASEHLPIPSTPSTKQNPIKSKSPSTRTIKSFTTNSKRKVHQLSLYLSPSKDQLNTQTSSATISSPMSLRSSMNFNDELDLDNLTAPSTPSTPVTPKFSNYFNANDMTDIKLNFNPTKFSNRSSPMLSNSSTFSTISSVSTFGSTSGKMLNFGDEYFPTDSTLKRQPSGTVKTKKSGNFYPASMEIINEVN